jgi:hypothetical protein
VPPGRPGRAARRIPEPTDPRPERCPPRPRPGNQAAPRPRSPHPGPQVTQPARATGADPSTGRWRGAGFRCPMAAPSTGRRRPGGRRPLTAGPSTHPDPSRAHRPAVLRPSPVPPPSPVPRPVRRCPRRAVAEPAGGHPAASPLHPASVGRLARFPARACRASVDRLVRRREWAQRASVGRPVRFLVWACRASVRPPGRRLEPVCPATVGRSAPRREPVPASADRSSGGRPRRAAGPSQGCPLAVMTLGTNESRRPRGVRRAGVTTETNRGLLARGVAVADPASLLGRRLNAGSIPLLLRLPVIRLPRLTAIPVSGSDSLEVAVNRLAVYRLIPVSPSRPTRRAAFGCAPWARGPEAPL